MKQNIILCFGKLIVLVILLILFLPYPILQAQTARPFITIWQTTADNEEITIPTSNFSGPYNYTIDWGDGTPVEISLTENVTHTYVDAGKYEVKITGDFPHIHFNGREGSDKIQSVKQWGDIQWKSMKEAFSGCRNLEITAIDAPDLSAVTDMSKMFQNATSFNQPIGSWDVSNVINMHAIFHGATSFNQDISNWNVSNVENMRNMFWKATSFNQDIGSWDVSNVINITFMFEEATAFNQDINDWDVLKVRSFTGLFKDATAFNQDISGWDMSSIESTTLMFDGATSFNQDISSWNVSHVIYMTGMFQGATSFNQDLGSWTSNAIARSNMFDGSGMDCSNYSATLIGWANDDNRRVENVRLGADGRTYGPQAEDARAALTARGWIISGDMVDLSCDSTTRPFITIWRTTADNEEITIPTSNLSGPYNYTVDWGDGTIDTDQTGDATHTYAEAKEHEVKITGDFPHIHFNGREGSDKIQAVTQWGDIQWKSMQQAFKGCSNLEVTATDVPDLSQVVLMTEMFQNATSFNGNIGDWDISNVESLTFMFQNATSFNQDISNWNPRNVNSMTGTFGGATSFNQDISGWDVSSVFDVRLVFKDAISFNQDISIWDVSNVATMRGMFEGATSFNQDLGSWTSNATDRTDMFKGSGLDCTNYSATLVGWANNTSVENVQLGADGLEYGTNVSDAINELITNRNWIINDHKSSGVQCLLFEIDPISDVTVKENIPFIGITPSITGVPKGNITYSVGGVDAALFNIDGTTGQVSMEARDYEAPEDANSDNIYEFSIIATDDYANSASESWRVMIEDVSELVTGTVTPSAGNVQVYPTPAEKQLNIVLNSNYGKVKQIVIRMVSGQERSRKTFSPGDVTDEGVLFVDISDLETGLYLLEVQGTVTNSIFRIKFYKK